MSLDGDGSEQSDINEREPKHKLAGKRYEDCQTSQSTAKLLPVSANLIFQPAPALLSEKAENFLKKLPRKIALRVGLSRITPAAKSQIEHQLNDLLGKATAEQLDEALRQALARCLFPPVLDDLKMPAGLVLVPLSSSILGEIKPKEAIQQLRHGETLAVPSSHLDHRADRCETSSGPVYRPRFARILKQRSRCELRLMSLEFVNGSWATHHSKAIDDSNDPHWTGFEKQHWRGIDLLSPRSLAPRNRWFDRPDLSCRIMAPLELREACFALPAIRSLLDISDSCKFDVICPPEHREFWTTIGNFEKVHCSIPSDSVDRIIWLRDVDPEQSSQLPPTLNAALSDKQHDSVITPEPAIPGPIRHRVRDYLDLAKSLGADPQQARFFPTLREANSDTILISPTSDFGNSHHWPTSHWKNWIESIDQRHQVLAIALPGQEEELTNFAQELGCETRNCSNIGDLIETLRKSGEIYAVDSTLVHLAAEMGLRCHVLFGPGEPDRHRPLGPHHVISRQKVSCNPCFLSECPIDHRCMMNLSFDS